MLYDAIQEMPDASAKKYLNELTAQWGPEGAVGWKSQRVNESTGLRVNELGDR